MHLRILLLGTLCLLAGCALPENVVVLMPDESGQVGLVRVSNAQGGAELHKAMGAVALNPGAPPGQPFTAEREPVAKVFGKTLQATPRRPKVFVLYFEPASTAVSVQSVPELAAAVEAARTELAPDVTVGIHLDRPSPPGIPDPLPGLRAQSVRDTLVKAGVRPSAIEIANYGASDPLVPPTGPAPDPRNLRLEVTVR